LSRAPVTFAAHPCFTATKLFTGRCDGDFQMVMTKSKQWVAAPLAALLLLAAANGVQAKGCLKGAAVGAVAGHVAHHHAVLGAAAGCIVGHHMAKKKEREEREQRRAQQRQQQTGA
jgi:hypothetical protein